MTLGEPSAVHRPTVLIVDDDGMLRHIIATNLQLGGDVPALYDPADRAKGYIAGKDRRGNQTRFPMMSLSLAIVTESARITNYQSIGEVAAELKSFAKSKPGSFVATDKRSR